MCTHTSVCVVTQKLPQLVELALQVHSPFSHVCELGQLCTLHCPSTALPQLLGTFKLRQMPLQRVKPCRHWQLRGQGIATDHSNKLTTLRHPHKLAPVYTHKHTFANLH
jgi:hypothetical protein